MNWLKRVLSKRMVLGVLLSLAIGLTATTGIVLAALAFNFTGTVQVVSTGGGGVDPNPPTPAITAYSEETATTVLTTVNWGSVNTGFYKDATIYLKNTGTADGVVALTSAATNGTVELIGAPVTVPVGGAIVPATVRFTAGGTADAAPVSFNVSLTY